MNPKSENTKIAIAFAAIYICWGSTYLAIRFALESFPPFLLAGMHFTIAGLLLYLWSRFSGTPAPSASNWINSSISALFLIVFGTGGLVLAERTLPSGLVSMLTAVAPGYFILFKWLTSSKHAPQPQALAGLFTGLAGVLTLIGPASIFFGHIDLIGLLCVFVASTCWTAGSLYFTSQNHDISPMMSVALQSLIGGLILELISICLNETSQMRFDAISLHSVLAVAYLIVFDSIIGFMAYFWLLKRIAPELVATHAYVNPVIAVLLGWALAGEKLTPQMIASSALILLSLWIIRKSERTADHIAL